MTDLKTLIEIPKNFGRKELIYWSNALCGESGEFANLVKKFYRNELKEDNFLCDFSQNYKNSELYNKMKEEIVDILIYIFLISRDILKFDLEIAFLEKIGKIIKRINKI